MAPGCPALTITSSFRARFEELLLSTVRTRVPRLDAELGRLLRRPGKRVRPALVRSAAECGPVPDMGAAVTCAAAVELLHQSSLIHDDLMDDTSYRGREPALHVSLGAGGAVLGGDYLVAAGGGLIAEIGTEAVRVWHEAYARMCVGQAGETSNRYRTDATVEDYLAAISGKTAALIRAACHLGGLCAGLPGPQVRALAEYGELFGLVFQVVDDLMDVLSTPELWGKPVQHDARVGVYTMPVLVALRDRGDALRKLLDGAPAMPVDRVYAMVRDAGTGPTLELLDDYVTRAHDALAVLPPTPARDRLATLPRQYLDDVLAHRVPEAHRELVRSAIPAQRIAS